MMKTSNTLPCDYDVVIVGGGLSGLVAAYRIKMKSPTITFCILEAEDRCGGKIATENGYDMGPRWFSKDQNHLIRLCDDLQIVYTPKEDEESMRVSENESSTSVLERSSHEFDQSRRKWDIDNSFFAGMARFELKRFLRYVDVLCQDYAPENVSVDIATDSSMESFLKRSLLFSASRDVVRLLVQAACGLNANNISLTEYMVLCYGTNGITNQLNSLIGAGDQLVILPNFELLVSKLLDAVGSQAVNTNAKVEKIQHLHYTVHVTCTDERKFVCQYVIVSIPLIDVHKIIFEPDLPRKYISPNIQYPNLVTSFVIKLASRARFSPPESIMKVHPQIVASPLYQSGTLCGMIFTESPMRERYNPPIKDQISKLYFPVNSPELQMGAKWFYRTWTPSLVCGLPMNKRWRRVIWAGTNSGTLYRGYPNGAIDGAMCAALQAMKMLRPRDIFWTDVEDLNRAKKVRRVSVGFFERQMYSLNVLNCMFFALVVCPGVYFGLRYVYADYDNIKQILMCSNNWPLIRTEVVFY